MAIWILIVIFHVHSGSNIEFQEFTTKERCEAARSHIQRVNEFASQTVTCMQK